MKSYAEIVAEVKEEMKGGKRTFNKELFTDLATAYLNDVNHVTDVVKTKNGELVHEDVNVPLNFRKAVKQVLLDFGVDKQEAEVIMTNEYQFKNLDCIYEVASETIMNYIDTGKKFTFLPKEDCTASLLLDEYEEEVKYNKNPKDPEAVAKPTLYKKHRKVKVESTCPAWLRELVEE